MKHDDATYYADLYDFAPISYFTVKRDGSIARANFAGADLLGIESDELEDKRFGAFVIDEDKPIFDAFFERVLESTTKETCDVTLLGKGTEKLDVHIEATCSAKLRECRFAVIDISEQKTAAAALLLDEARLESLMRISQLPTTNMQELLDFSLGEAIALTGSKVGYLYFYDEATDVFTLKSWSREVMQESLTHEPATMERLLKAGLWGEAVRQRRPIMVNDVAGQNQGRAMPQGHMRLIRYLSVPVFIENRIVAVVGMCNKQEDYNESDIRQLNLMMDAVSKIVQRRQSEQNLRESEQRYRTLADSGTVLIWTSGIDKKCDYFNERWLRFTGRGLEQELGDGWAEGVHPDDLRRCVEIYTAAFDKREKFSMEYRLHHASGEYRSIQDDGAPRFSSDGEFLGYIGHCLDITQHKADEEAMKLDEARLESLLRINQYPAKDIQDLLDFALNEAISLTRSKIGYIYFYDEEKKEFILNTWSKEVMRQCSVAKPPEQYPLEKTGIWGEAVRQGRPIIVNDFESPNPYKKGMPEGHVVLLKFLTIPVFVEGHIVAVAGVANKKDDYNDSDTRQLNLMMDAVWKIAQGKKTQEALRESEERYRSIFDTAANLIISVTQDGMIVDCNHRVSEVLGYGQEEIIGQPAEKIIHPDSLEKARATLKEIFAQNNTYDRECQMLRKDGTVVEVSVNSSTIRDADNKPLRTVCIIEDITRRKNADAKLAEQLDELCRWQNATLGREGRVLELKREINQLLAEAGRPIRYPSTETEGQKTQECL